MKRFISLLAIATFLLSVVSCDYQKQETKTKEEIKRYSINCVSSFLEKVYKQSDSGRDWCFAYTLPNGNNVTLYDAAIELGVKWNPDEVNIQKDIELVCDSNNILKYVEVNAVYKGKTAIFRVGFDKGLVDHPETMSSSIYRGSNGTTVILDSEGFLPDKIAEQEKKQHIKFHFGAQNDLINYMLTKGVADYKRRADFFFDAAERHNLDYRDSKKRGKLLSRYVLDDSIKTARLIGFEYNQNLLKTLDNITDNGTIELYAQPCVLKYTNSVSVYMRKYAYDSMGFIDWTQYCGGSCDGSRSVAFCIMLNAYELTDIQLYDKTQEELEYERNLQESQRHIERLRNQSQY